MRITLFTTFLLAALVLAACGTTPVPGFSLEYQRSGGIAGVDDRLVVDADGNATLTRSGQATEFTLDAETIAGLQALLDEAGFADLDAEYLPAQQGADLFEYTLTYLGHTVRTADTAVPAGLQPVLDELSRIIDAGGQP